MARDALRSYANCSGMSLPKEVLASTIYALFATNSGASKAIAAQYLACLLEARQQKGQLSSATLRAMLPPYLVRAIDYVTIINAGDTGAKEETAPRE